MRRRGSLFGPILLLALGVLFLLRNFWPEIPVWELFGKYWPVLLIILGLAKLLQALHPTEPGAPRYPVITGGEVFLIFLISMIGWGVYKGRHLNITDWEPWWGQNYTFTQEAKQAVSEKNPNIMILNPSGGIHVMGSDAAEISVKAEKGVKAGNESEAKNLGDSAKLEITREGSQYMVRSNADRAEGRGSLRVALEVHVPRGAQLDLQGRRGDIQVSEVAGPVSVTAERGDVSLSDIGGKVKLDIRRGSLTAERIKGGIDMDGRGNDIQVTDVDGEVVIRGEYGGTVAFANVKQVVHMTTSRTELQIQKLPGKVEMTIGSLTITQPSGPVSVTTRAKDIRIEDFDGPVQVVNRDAAVELSTSKLPVKNIEVENKSGRIELSLPASGQFQVEASAHRGEVNSDFSEISVERQHEQGTMRGAVGKNGASVKLSTTYGTISLRKQS